MARAAAETRASSASAHPLTRIFQFPPLGKNRRFLLPPPALSTPRPRPLLPLPPSFHRPKKGRMAQCHSMPRPRISSQLPLYKVITWEIAPFARWKHASSLPFLGFNFCDVSNRRRRWGNLVRLTRMTGEMMGEILSRVEEGRRGQAAIFVDVILRFRVSFGFKIFYAVFISFFFFPSFETINNRASKQIWKFIFSLQFI